MSNGGLQCPLGGKGLEGVEEAIGGGLFLKRFGNKIVRRGGGREILHPSPMWGNDGRWDEGGKEGHLFTSSKHPLLRCFRVGVGT